MCVGEKADVFFFDFAFYLFLPGSEFTPSSQSPIPKPLPRSRTVGAVHLAQFPPRTLCYKLHRNSHSEEMGPGASTSTRLSCWHGSAMKGAADTMLPNLLCRYSWTRNPQRHLPEQLSALWPYVLKSILRN